MAPQDSIPANAFAQHADEEKSADPARTGAGQVRRNGGNDEGNGDEVSHRSIRRVCSARATREHPAKHSGAAFRRDDPGAIYPWGIVANVLAVTAFELCHPMMLFVLPKANDLLLHGVQGRAGRARGQACIRDT